jgi:hypothetical protein
MPGLGTNGNGGDPTTPSSSHIPPFGQEDTKEIEGNYPPARLHTCRAAVSLRARRKIATSAELCESELWCTAARFWDTRLSLCCQPSTSVAEYGRVASPVKASLRPPPSAADGLDRACHPAIVCHQEFDGKARLKCTQVPILRRPTLDRPLCSDQACIDRLAPGLGYDSRAKFRCSEWRTRRVRLAALRWSRRLSPTAGSLSRFG